ncbi:hypothetical protein ACMFMG_010633 [Clarireedia jacksonii]
MPLRRTPPGRGRSGRPASAEPSGSPSRSAPQSTTVIPDTQDTLEASQEAQHQAGDESSADSRHYSPPPVSPFLHEPPISLFPAVQPGQNVNTNPRGHRRSKGKAVQRSYSEPTSESRTTDATLAAMMKKLEQIEARFTALAGQVKKQQLYVLNQLEGLALQYYKGLYIQDNITSKQIIDEVANFLTDPAKRQRAQDTYAHLVQLEGQPFEPFYQQFELLASIAGKTNPKDKHQDLIRKLSNDYRIQSLIDRLGSTDYKADVKVLQHLDTDDAGIAASKQARRAPAKAVAAAISRRKRAATYAKSRQTLQGQSGIPAVQPGYASQPTTPANIPRHFSPGQRTTPPVQSGGFNRSSPLPALQTRAQTPRHTVGEVEYDMYEDAMEDIVEEDDVPPEAQAEAVAHAKQQEVDRAKDGA